MNYNVKKLNINDIDFDVQNPRIKLFTEMYGDSDLDDEKIGLALSTSEDDSSNSNYLALKESIKNHGGLINPIIVNKTPDGKYTVIEGNTRLHIYREFAKENFNGLWDEIECMVYENLTQREIHSIRLQAHLVGPREWDPFSKAKYLYNLCHNENVPLDVIVELCGNKYHEIKKLISAYEDMKFYYFEKVDAAGKTLDPKEFSKFIEFQNRNIQEAMIQNHFDKNDFARWVINGNIDKALNVRRLAEILNNREARRVFLESNATEAIKYLNLPPKSSLALSKSSIYELSDALLNKIRNIEHKEVRKLVSNPEYKDNKKTLSKLSKELTSLLKDLRGISK